MRIAAYARYSSNKQRDASLDDQLRNCRSYAQRQGWPEPVAYTDAAISGAREDRPGYRALLRDASERRFDVVLVDDLSRLSRDSTDCAKAVKRLTFSGIRLVGISDGVDTARKSHKSHKADVGLRGLMSELYLDDLAEKTHRGLTGRALAGASAGGLPYGYTITQTGQRAVYEAEAAIVRRIYTEYLAGRSPREIAASLNHDGVKSPSGHAWGHSSVRGDRKRGLGILVNPIYAGRQVWNRSKWIKHPDRPGRVRRERPQSEWIVTEHPDLRIIEPALFEAAQRRMQSRGFTLAKDSGRRGAPHRHLLSGLLRCGACGASMVVVDKYAYGCMAHRERGTCTSRLRVPRVAAERALLAGIRAQLLTESAFQRFQRGVAAALKESVPDERQAQRKLAEAERVRGNLLAALRAGIITPGIREEMLAAEAEVAVAKREVESVKMWRPATFLPRAREVWQRIVDDLAGSAARAPGAQEALRALIGDEIVVRNENGVLLAEVTPSNLIEVVAGAGSVPCMSRPFLVPIPRQPVAKCSQKQALPQDQGM